MERARIILLAAQGRSNKEIAGVLGTRAARVSKWRVRFEREGLAGLHDDWRPGRPPGEEADAFRRRLLSRLDQKQPAGFARWNGALLAKALAVSPDRVWRELRCLGISLQRRRSWVRLHRSAVCAKSRQALRGASFRSVKELTDAIDAFIAAYNKTAAPFAWRKLNVTPKSFASK